MKTKTKWELIRRQRKSKLEFFISAPHRQDKLICPICQVDFEDNDEVIELKWSAKHMFHEEWIKDWLVRKQDWPLCRKDLLDIEYSGSSIDNSRPSVLDQSESKQSKRSVKKSAVNQSYVSYDEDIEQSIHDKSSEFYNQLYIGNINDMTMARLELFQSHSSKKSSKISKKSQKSKIDEQVPQTVLGKRFLNFLYLI